MLGKNLDFFWNFNWSYIFHLSLIDQVETPIYIYFNPALKNSEIKDFVYGSESKLVQEVS